MIKTLANKSVTITDIAEYVRVSPATVSYVLNSKAREKKISGETERRIMDVASQVGYVPHMWARGLQRQKTQVISVLLGNLVYSWAESLVLGIENVVEKSDFNYFIGLHHWIPEKEKSELDLVMQRRDEGVICLPVLNSKQVYANIANKGIPVVLLETIEGLSQVSYVCWDGTPGTRSVVEHMVSIGRKKIGFVGVQHGTVETDARFGAYCDVLRQSGLEINERFIKKLYIPMKNLPITETFDQAIDSLFEGQDRPDAVFFLNDALAIQGLECLHRKGIKVPDDVAIAGLGDLPICADFGLGITTVTQPTWEVGRVAAEVLLEHIQRGKFEPIQQKVHGCELKIRRSTVG